MNVSHLSDAQLQTDLIRARQLLQDAPSFLAHSKAAQQIEAIFDSPDESPKQAVTPWYICSILSKELGGSPDEWFRASPTKLEEGIKVVEEIRAAEEKAAGGKKQPPKPTPLLYAIRDFNEELLKLEQSWQVD